MQSNGRFDEVEDTANECERGMFGVPHQANADHIRSVYEYFANVYSSAAHFLFKINSMFMTDKKCGLWSPLTGQFRISPIEVAILSRLPKLSALSLLNSFACEQRAVVEA